MQIASDLRCARAIGAAATLAAQLGLSIPAAARLEPGAGPTLRVSRLATDGFMWAAGQRRWRCSSSVPVVG